ncbi:Cell morphogenesis protein PAG1 [Mycoemilia scoparia]|uniref:Cell morphogenesis protein PAG1 n=1 Tax=Mycoemilia scoparia TaxID=417184 RepID=A0A9W7ZUB4_9FUNG|nr:Cell morphogenesis protein PAG1 [Mycoemilia scoparia]
MSESKNKPKQSLNSRDDELMHKNTQGTLQSHSEKSTPNKRLISQNEPLKKNPFGNYNLADAQILPIPQKQVQNSHNDVIGGGGDDDNDDDQFSPYIPGSKPFLTKPIRRGATERDFRTSAINSPFQGYSLMNAQETTNSHVGGDEGNHLYNRKLSHQESTTPMSDQYGTIFELPKSTDMAIDLNAINLNSINSRYPSGIDLGNTGYVAPVADLPQLDINYGVYDDEDDEDESNSEVKASRPNPKGPDYKMENSPVSSSWVDAGASPSTYREDSAVTPILAPEWGVKFPISNASQDTEGLSISNPGDKSVLSENPKVFRSKSVEPTAGKNLNRYENTPTSNLYPANEAGYNDAEYQGIDDREQIEEYTVRSMYERFKIQAQKKLDAVVSTRFEKEPDFSLYLDYGVDPTMDALLDALGRLARRKPLTVIELLLVWRKTTVEPLGNPTSASSDRYGSQGDDPSVGGARNELNNTDPSFASRLNYIIKERKSLASVYILCRALIAVVKHLDSVHIEGDLGDRLEDIVFSQVQNARPENLRASKNRRRIQDLYAQLIGRISRLRFVSMSDRFIAELERIPRTPGVTDDEIIILIRSMRYLELRLYPISALEESSQFLLSCAKFYSRTSGSLRLKHAWASTLTNLLMPIAAVADAEVNIPDLVQAIEIIQAKASKMCLKVHHINVAFPLAAATLCMSRKEVFQQRWQTLLEQCIQRLKDKQLRKISMDTICRLLWTYFFRYSEPNSITVRKIENMYRIFFPATKAYAWPKTVPLDYFVYFLTCTGCYNFDFSMTNHYHYLLQMDKNLIGFKSFSGADQSDNEGMSENQAQAFRAAIARSIQASSTIVESINPIKVSLAYLTIVRIGVVLSQQSSKKYPPFLSMDDLLPPDEFFENSLDYGEDVDEKTSSSWKSLEKASIDPQLLPQNVQTSIKMVARTATCYFMAIQDLFRSSIIKNHPQSYHEWTNYMKNAYDFPMPHLIQHSWNSFSHELLQQHLPPVSRERSKWSALDKFSGSSRGEQSTSILYDRESASSGLAGISYGGAEAGSASRNVYKAQPSGLRYDAVDYPQASYKGGSNISEIHHQGNQDVYPYDPSSSSSKWLKTSTLVSLGSIREMAARYPRRQQPYVDYIRYFTSTIPKVPYLWDLLDHQQLLDILVQNFMHTDFDLAESSRRAILDLLDSSGQKSTPFVDEPGNPKRVKALFQVASRLSLMFRHIDDRLSALLAGGLFKLDGTGPSSRLHQSMAKYSPFPSWHTSHSSSSWPSSAKTITTSVSEKIPTQSHGGVAGGLEIHPSGGQVVDNDSDSDSNIPEPKQKSIKQVYHATGQENELTGGFLHFWLEILQLLEKALKDWLASADAKPIPSHDLLIGESIISPPANSRGRSSSIQQSPNVAGTAFSEWVKLLDILDSNSIIIVCNPSPLIRWFGGKLLLQSQTIAQALCTLLTPTSPVVGSLRPSLFKLLETIRVDVPSASHRRHFSSRGSEGLVDGGLWGEPDWSAPFPSLDASKDKLSNNPKSYLLRQKQGRGVKVAIGELAVSLSDFDQRLWLLELPNFIKKGVQIQPDIFSMARAMACQRLCDLCPSISQLSEASPKLPSVLTRHGSGAGASSGLADTSSMSGNQGGTTGGGQAGATGGSISGGGMPSTSSGGKSGGQPGGLGSGTSELFEVFCTYLLLGITSIGVTEQTTNLGSNTNFNSGSGSKGTSNKLLNAVRQLTRAKLLSSKSGKRDMSAGEISIGRLVRLVMPFLYSENSSIRQGLVVSLSNIPPMYLPELIAELKPASAVVAKDNLQRLAQWKHNSHHISGSSKSSKTSGYSKRTDKFRLSLTQLHKLVARNLDYIMPNGKPLKLHEGVVSGLIGYIQETRTFLSEKSVQADWEHQKLRINFCELVEALYYHISYAHVPQSYLDKTVDKKGGDSIPSRGKRDTLTPLISVTSPYGAPTNSSKEKLGSHSSLGSKHASGAGSSLSIFKGNTPQAQNASKASSTHSMESLNRTLNNLLSEVDTNPALLAACKKFTTETRNAVCQLVERWCGFGKLGNYTRENEADMMKGVLDQHKDSQDRGAITSHLERERRGLEEAALRAMAVLGRVMFSENPYEKVNREKVISESRVLFTWTADVFVHRDIRLQAIGQKAIEWYFGGRLNLGFLFRELIQKCWGTARSLNNQRLHIRGISGGDKSGSSENTPFYLASERIASSYFKALAEIVSNDRRREAVELSATSSEAADTDASTSYNDNDAPTFSLSIILPLSLYMAQKGQIETRKCAFDVLYFLAENALNNWKNMNSESHHTIEKYSNRLRSLKALEQRIICQDRWVYTDAWKDLSIYCAMFFKSKLPKVLNEIASQLCESVESETRTEVLLEMLVSWVDNAWLESPSGSLVDDANMGWDKASDLTQSSKIILQVLVYTTIRGGDVFQRQIQSLWSRLIHHPQINDQLGPDDLMDESVSTLDLHNFYLALQALTSWAYEWKTMTFLQHFTRIIMLMANTPLLPYIIQWCEHALRPISFVPDQLVDEINNASSGDPLGYPSTLEDTANKEQWQLNLFSHCRLSGSSLVLVSNGGLALLALKAVCINHAWKVMSTIPSIVHISILNLANPEKWVQEAASDILQSLITAEYNSIHESSLVATLNNETIYELHEHSDSSIKLLRDKQWLGGIVDPKQNTSGMISEIAKSKTLISPPGLAFSTKQHSESSFDKFYELVTSIVYVFSIRSTEISTLWANAALFWGASCPVRTIALISYKFWIALVHSSGTAASTASGLNIVLSTEQLGNAGTRPGIPFDQWSGLASTTHPSPSNNVNLDHRMLLIIIDRLTNVVGDEDSSTYVFAVQVVEAFKEYSIAYFERRNSSQIKRHSSTATPRPYDYNGALDDENKSLLKESNDMDPLSLSTTQSDFAIPMDIISASISLMYVKSEIVYKTALDVLSLGITEMDLGNNHELQKQAYHYFVEHWSKLGDDEDAMFHASSLIERDDSLNGKRKLIFPGLQPVLLRGLEYPSCRSSCLSMMKDLLEYKVPGLISPEPLESTCIRLVAAYFPEILEGCTVARISPSTFALGSPDSSTAALSVNSNKEDPVSSQTELAQDANSASKEGDKINEETPTIGIAPDIFSALRKSTHPGHSTRRNLLQKWRSRHLQNNATVTFDPSMVVSSVGGINTSMAKSTGSLISNDMDWQSNPSSQSMQLFKLLKTISELDFADSDHKSTTPGSKQVFRSRFSTSSRKSSNDAYKMSAPSSWKASSSSHTNTNSLKSFCLSILNRNFQNVYQLITKFAYMIRENYDVLENEILHIWLKLMFSWTDFPEALVLFDIPVQKIVDDLSSSLMDVSDIRGPGSALQDNDCNKYLQTFREIRRVSRLLECIKSLVKTCEGVFPMKNSASDNDALASLFELIRCTGITPNVSEVLQMLLKRAETSKLTRSSTQASSRYKSWATQMSATAMGTPSINNEDAVNKLNESGYAWFDLDDQTLEAYTYQALSNIVQRGLEVLGQELFEEHDDTLKTMYMVNMDNPDLYQQEYYPSSYQNIQDIGSYDSQSLGIYGAGSIPRNNILRKQSPAIANSTPSAGGSSRIPSDSNYMSSPYSESLITTPMLQLSSGNMADISAALNTTANMDPLRLMLPGPYIPETPLMQHTHFDSEPMAQFPRLSTHSSPGGDMLLHSTQFSTSIQDGVKASSPKSFSTIETSPVETNVAPPFHRLPIPSIRPHSAQSAQLSPLLSCEDDNERRSDLGSWPETPSDEASQDEPKSPENASNTSTSQEKSKPSENQWDSFLSELDDIDRYFEEALKVSNSETSLDETTQLDQESFPSLSTQHQYKLASNLGDYHTITSSQTAAPVVEAEIGTGQKENIQNTHPSRILTHQRSKSSLGSHPLSFSVDIDSQSDASSPIVSSSSPKV